MQQTEMRTAGHTERTGGRKMQDSFDTMIVGGGAAGYTAALYLARGGLHTLLLERQYAGGQMALTGRVENYPGFPEGIDGAALGLAMQRGAERFGAVTVYDEVLHTAISGEQKRVFTKSQTFCAVKKAIKKAIEKYFRTPYVRAAKAFISTICGPREFIL